MGSNQSYSQNVGQQVNQSNLISENKNIIDNLGDKNAYIKTNKKPAEININEYPPDYNSIQFTENSRINNIVYGDGDLEHLSQYDSTNRLTEANITNQIPLYEEEFSNFFNNINNSELQELRQDKDKLSEELINCQTFIKIYDLNYEFYLDRLSNLSK